MARAAGVRAESAHIIAYAAQFVDDNAVDDTILLKDGGRVDVLATAHHWHQISNINLENQRLVWVPFHFLPGNEGDEYTERLICRMDSVIAREMVDHNISLADRDFALELMGVTAHVYADTFSHYGFSGVSSRRNKVHGDAINLENLEGSMRDYVPERAANFFEKYGFFGGLEENIRAAVSDAAELGSGALGHGSVATYPDRPYLHWNFTYEQSGENSRRRNDETFFDGCRALHGMFRRFLEVNSDYAGDHGREFSSIEETVQNILTTQADCAGRIAAWQDGAQGGALFLGNGESIPEYHEEEWHDQRDTLVELGDSREATLIPVFRFFQAAANHRTFILRDLLPSHGIVAN